jgi:transcription elongation factor GreA
MSNDQYFLTPEGLRKIETQLERLRNVRRHEVAERLHNALAEGGELGEDAEYEDAKNEQAFVEGEIARLETIISNVRIIDEDAPKDEVSLGNHVTLREKGSRTDESYHIVGEAEADPAEGKISHRSPLGSALLGHKVKDKVTVQAPDGELVFTIRAID